MKECLDYLKIESRAVECRACNHFCRIADGHTGICGVRENQGGRLRLLVYGAAVAVNIDPIEKKPLFHFLPASKVFSFGTLGCNFRCYNCQNYDISQMFGRKAYILKYSELDMRMNFPPEKIVEEAVRTGCKSIAYTYNEPTIFIEYALDTMKLARAAGLKNIWVSNGFMSTATLDRIIPWLDAINVDIKSFSEDFYRANCGAKLSPVLDNCRRLAQEKVWFEITTLIIPTLTDSAAMLARIAEFIKKELGDFVPWHVSAFSGAISWKLKHLDDTPVSSIKRAYDIGRETGLKYVYAGNIPSGEMENTVCPSCSEIVIGRRGYDIERRDKKGACPKCGVKIAGFWL